MTRRLPVLSNSSLTTFRRCPREYYYASVLRRRPKVKADALRFGSLFHVGLNAWWGAHDDPSLRLTAAIVAMRSSVDVVDPFDLAKAEALMTGYTARWGDEPYETIAVEQQFRLPIEGTDAEQCGAIDAIVRTSGTGSAFASIHNVEHKTTSQDISPGSNYWRHVQSLDSQVSTYDAAAKALGYDVRDTIYDVIRKPNLLPLKATPEESKKYTRPTKAEPVPRLYANMRETDETPDEYRERLFVDIASNPDRYYQRATIVRLEAENEAHALDVLHTAEMIRFAEQRNAWPRTVSACERYNRLCDYHDVCSGHTDINDSRYETKESTHEV